jgi:NAD(P)-dependent dehydrogenase (short-subunit alcohol dehydrogenase family)
MTMTTLERFRNKVVLVTGASSGIGRATALRLAAEGARVVAAGRRRERLDELGAEIEQSGHSMQAVTGDVRDEDVGRAWVQAAIERFGQLDGLVQAAGVIGSTGVLDTEPAEWDRIMDSNLRSLYLMTRAAAAALIDSHGSIVNVSSVGGIRPYGAITPYCVSKAGVDMLTQCTALEFAPHGVRVNAVNPGVVRTELHTVTNAVPDYAGFLERSKTTHPLGRYGEASEVAGLIAYLMSGEAGWVTGGMFSIDGGRALASAR